MHLRRESPSRCSESLPFHFSSNLRTTLYMYRLIDRSYTLADIGRFTELSIRRGIPLASVVKTELRDRRVVAGAALLFVPTAESSEETLLQRFEGFLQGTGSWLKAEPAELLSSALEEGLLEAAGDPQAGAPARWRSRLEPLPGVTANRLADELEAAQEILKLRRARMRETLQAKNREVNRPPELPVDAEADRSFMRMALEEAQAAGMAGEIPVGAVVVADGKVIARGGNETLRSGDPTAHAEIVALRAAAAALANHRLTNTTLYVTLEPCPMCAGAIAEARCRRIVYGAVDSRRGALEGAFRLFDIPGVNHRPMVTGGVMALEGEKLLTDFFAKRRSEQAAQKAAESSDAPQNCAQ